MISNISVRNRYYFNNSNTGAIVCHTTKALCKCLLVNNIDDLVSNFGDPYIDPTMYSDLILAYDLVKHGVPLYISSIDEMEHHTDGFEYISYNGYTEFYFVKDSYDIIGYRLKSDIKFCQPIVGKLEATKENNNLNIYVYLYYLDRCLLNNVSFKINSDRKSLYKILQFSYSLNSSVDSDIIADFRNSGLELQIIYQGSDDKAFIKALESYTRNTLIIDVQPDNDIVYTNSYRYNLHSDYYTYNFSDELVRITAYENAINLLSNILPTPVMACMGRMFKSPTSDSGQNTTVDSALEPIDVDSHIEICNFFMNCFPEECDTYLFINTPDLSVSSILTILDSSNITGGTYLNERYNCDLFFGYATDYVNRSCTDNNLRRVHYSAALLSFYNLMISGSTYLTNNFIDLNISNKCVKLVLSESSAEKLKDCRCNSMVLFDTGHPSTYGDRSLSMMPNLRYSHISRNLVRLRRIINEYLETKKFILNTMYYLESTMSYIKTQILDDAVSKGVISNYSLSYYSENQTVTINIILIFPFVADSISLQFTI